MKTPSLITTAMLSAGLLLTSGAAAAADGANSSLSLLGLQYSTVSAGGTASTSAFAGDYAFLSADFALMGPGQNNTIAQNGDFKSLGAESSIATHAGYQTSNTDASLTGYSGFQINSNLINTAGLESYATTAASTRGSLTLAAHSTFTFSGSAAGSLNAFAPTFNGSSVLDITLTDGEFGPSVASYDKNLTLGLGQHAGSFSDNFSLTYTNTSDADMTLFISIDGNSGVHTAFAVPEPSSYAMLMAGLALVGFAVRQRRRG